MAIVEQPLTSDKPQLSRRDEVALAFFGTWMSVGLYLDGWAHIHNKPESFFTPWHGILYSGFGAAVLYFMADARLREARGQPRPLPRLMVIGLGLFGLGAVGDFGWHSIFGIEVDLETLLSPTHLTLLVGGVLMIAGPFRSASARHDDGRPSFTTFWPALVSIALATTTASFFLMYLSAFEFGGLYSSGGQIHFVQQIHGIAAVLVTNMLLLVPTLFVLRRWRPPAGSFTILYTAVALSMIGMNGFDWPVLIVPAIIGGLVADALASRGAVAVGAIVPAVMWTAWVIAEAGALGTNWPVELLVGTVLLATMSGAVLGALAAPVQTVART